MGFPRGCVPSALLPAIANPGSGEWERCGDGMGGAFWGGGKLGLVHGLGSHGLGDEGSYGLWVL